MKELLAHASNFLFAPDYDADQKTRLKARVELILVCSEPEYSVGVEGLTRRREVSSTRVMCSHQALRDMGKQLIALAEEAEALEKAQNDATSAVGAA